MLMHFIPEHLPCHTDYAPVKKFDRTFKKHFSKFKSYLSSLKYTGATSRCSGYKSALLRAQTAVKQYQK